jgi:hypothetical protein
MGTTEWGEVPSNCVSCIATVPTNKVRRTVLPKRMIEAKARIAPPKVSAMGDFDFFIFWQDAFYDGLY